MTRSFFAFFFSCLLIETAVAKPMVDCRVAIGDITECNPYGAKLLKAKEIAYDIDHKKLIRVKILPVPQEKDSLRVVPVKEMLDKYNNVGDPKRFRGSDFLTLHEKFAKKSASQKLEKVEVCTVEPAIKRDILKKIIPKQPLILKGEYVVVQGDALSKLAKKFGFKTKELAKMNGLSSKASLIIGQKLRLPFEQKVVDAMVSGEYKVEECDTLLSIAKMFDLDPKAIVEFNGIKDSTMIQTGNMIKLPLPYLIAKKKKAEARKKKEVALRQSGKVDLLQQFGKNKLRVTATAYTSHISQTDKTPFLAAWNNRLYPGIKAIAVSRDLLSKYGLRNGTKVRIAGLPGFYRVRDKMNKRYKKRIDVYMGVDRNRALRWGRRSVVIYW
jgi:LysM repeat protein